LRTSTVIIVVVALAVVAVWIAARRSARTRIDPNAPPSPKDREDARRFARLLASEIRLYNPRDVEDGRRYGDLYARLRSDIDQSRALYRSRVRRAVRDDEDYFRDALIEVLADGDATALEGYSAGEDRETVH
jgi:hypothetical protein